MSEARIGPFRLRRKLGSGGMGEVWEAVPAAGGPAVALKWSSPGASVARFKEEVRISRTLNHPNVIKALDSGVDGGRPWIALELLEGATLSQLRKQQEGPWPPGLVVAIGMQALAALSAVHGEGGTPSIIHRDIKPSNLFLCRDGTLRLIDFGIALSDDEDRTRTKSGNIVASVRYSSPEQARGERVDHRTDLFSVGLVLTELLAGRRVYDQPDDVGVLSALLFQPPPRPGALAASLPPALEEALASALRSSPASRPPSASVLRDALSASLEGPPWTRADVAAWVAPLIDRAQLEHKGTASGSREGTPELARTPPTGPERPSRMPIRSASPVPGRAWRWLVLFAAVVGLGGVGAALLTREGDAVQASAEVRGDSEASGAMALGPAEVLDPATGGKPTTVVNPAEVLDPATGANPTTVVNSATGVNSAAGLNSATEGVEAEPSVSAPQQESPPTSAPEKRRAVTKLRRTAPTSSQTKSNGWLSVGVSKGWATVTIDGRPAGETPLFRVELAAGTHTLKAVAHDGKTWTRRIRVSANREAKVFFER